MTPEHNIIYKNIDIVFKNKNYISYFIIKLDKMIYKRSSSKFHWYTLGGSDFMKAAYKLMDNPIVVLLKRQT